MAAKARKVWRVIKRTTRGAKMTAGLQLYKISCDTHFGVCVSSVESYHR